MENIYEKLVLVILGWVLGLFSPIIASAINKYHERKSIIITLTAELNETKFKLISIVYLIACNMGRYDKQLLEWVYQSLSKYKGNYHDIAMIEAIERQLKLSEEELAALGRCLRKEDGTRVHLKKVSTVILDFQSQKLGVLDESSLSLLLEIRTKCHLINEEVDQYRYYFNLTFNASTSELNREILNVNMDNSYATITEQAKITVDLISILLKKW